MHQSESQKLHPYEHQSLENMVCSTCSLKLLVGHCLNLVIGTQGIDISWKFQLEPLTITSDNTFFIIVDCFGVIKALIARLCFLVLVFDCKLGYTECRYREKPAWPNHTRAGLWLIVSHYTTQSLPALSTIKSFLLSDMDLWDCGLYRYSLPPKVDKHFTIVRL